MWPDSVTTDDCTVDMIMLDSASSVAEPLTFALTAV
jgi:hypothetical protein